MGQATGQPAGLKGTGYQQVQTFTPEQMQLFQQMFGQVGPQSYLGKLAGGDQSQFEQLEAPALKQFNQLQGGLASRFSGMGSGARRSSGFQNTANQASMDFASQLQSQRMGLQRQAMQDLMGMSQHLLGQSPYELTPEKRPFWQELLLSTAGGAGDILSRFIPGRQS
jgi:hypothetical protein